MSDGIGSIIGNKKPQGLNAGAYLASKAEDPCIKKQNNPLSNESLPGGIFTYHGTKMS